MRICRGFENLRDLRALSGEFLGQKSCYLESFRFSDSAFEVTKLQVTFCVVINTLTVSDVGDKEFAHLVFLHSYFYGFDIIEVL